MYGDPYDAVYLIGDAYCQIHTDCTSQRICAGACMFIVFEYPCRHRLFIVCRVNTFLRLFTVGYKDLRFRQCSILRTVKHKISLQKFYQLLCCHGYNIRYLFCLSQHLIRIKQNPGPVSRLCSMKRLTFDLDRKGTCDKCGDKHHHKCDRISAVVRLKRKTRHGKEKN